MAMICLKCYEIYDPISTKHDKKRDWNCCPKVNCLGNVIEVDELMLPVIQILNSKGYFTQFCCSGHAYEKSPNSYIKFADEVDLPNYPEGFHWESDNVIRKRFVTDNYITKYENVLETAKIVYKWARELPINPRLEELRELYE